MVNPQQSLDTAVESSALELGLIAAGVALAVSFAAEVIQIVRVRRVAPLAFGPRAGLVSLALGAGLMRVGGLTLAAFGLAVLAALPAKSHRATELREADYKHLVLVLDVSPSMQLQDAAKGGVQKRSERAADLLQSFFDRVSAEKYKTTVIAFYTDAKMVVEDTTDREVVRNILTELPMRHAFKTGESDLFSGLKAAANVAKPWNPGSAVVMVISDGDSVPASGMPKMPVSVGTNIVLVGVGNPVSGKSIGGHQSRQDVSNLRQTAVRLNGTYHDGNEKQLPTELVSRIDERATPPAGTKFSLRERALWAVGLGCSGVGLLPLMLGLLGTGWAPGRSPGLVRRDRLAMRASIG